MGLKPIYLMGRKNTDFINLINNDSKNKLLFIILLGHAISSFFNEKRKNDNFVHIFKHKGLKWKKIKIKD